MLVEEVFVQLDRDARGRSARVGLFFYFGVGDRTRAATEECRHREAPHFISVAVIGIAPPPSQQSGQIFNLVIKYLSIQFKHGN